MPRLANASCYTVFVTLLSRDTDTASVYTVGGRQTACGAYSSYRLVVGVPVISWRRTHPHMGCQRLLLLWKWTIATASLFGDCMLHPSLWLGHYIQIKSQRKSQGASYIHPISWPINLERNLFSYECSMYVVICLTYYVIGFCILERDQSMLHGTLCCGH